jgi:Uma2 family endonuclease
MALQLPRHKFTVDEYAQMGVSGIFDEDDRVELLDGDIVEMSPLGSRHVRCVNRLNMLLTPRLVGQAIVQVQSSLRLDVYWEPVPDVAVLRLREDDYRSGLPTGADVLLLIEVADSSRSYDRAKLPAYARSGIPEVWLVDLRDQVLLSHRQPTGAEYRIVQAFRGGESITPQALPEQVLSVESVLD